MTEITKFESKDGIIYKVDGKQYRELERDVVIGDILLIADAEPNDDQHYENGDIFTLERLDSDGDARVQDPMELNIICKSEFVIVEPIEATPELETAQLSRKLTRLEERVEENHRNILTFSQMAESARSDTSKAIGGVNALGEQLELVREDIVFLDEKLSKLEEAEKSQNITININVLDIESAKVIVESITRGR